jgi:hypothetical protein
MKTLVDQLSQYASYHRDRRNIITHFIGIPMIVASVCLLLSRPALAGLPWLTPGALVATLASIYYLRLDVRYGLVLSAYLAACLAWSQALAAGELMPWLSWGLARFCRRSGRPADRAAVRAGRSRLLAGAAAGGRSRHQCAGGCHALKRPHLHALS